MKCTCPRVIGESPLWKEVLVLRLRGFLSLLHLGHLKFTRSHLWASLNIYYVSFSLPESSSASTHWVLTTKQRKRRTWETGNLFRHKKHFVFLWCAYHSPHTGMRAETGPWWECNTFTLLYASGISLNSLGNVNCPLALWIWLMKLISVVWGRLCIYRVEMDGDGTGISTENWVRQDICDKLSRLPR